MSSFNLSISTRCSVTLHVCTNIAVFRQSSFWDHTDKVFQFVPCHDYGLVVATLKNKPAGSAVLRGWVIYRPKALELVWPSNQDVNMVEIDLGTILAWYQKSNERWEHLGTPMRNPTEHVVPR